MKTFLCCGLLALHLASGSVFACSIAADHAPRQPTEAQWLAKSDLVLMGKVVAVEPERGNEVKWGRPYKFTLSVTQWIKGGDGETEIAVFDALKNPCDMAKHLVQGGNSGDGEWRIFLERRGTSYWVISAYRQDPP